MVATKPSKILIFGGTGQIGQFITSALLSANPAFEKVTLFTSPTTASTKTNLLADWTSRGLEIITGDLTNATDLRAAFRDHDTIISAVGRGVLDTQLDIIGLAEENSSVQWFLPSEYGTDVEYDPDRSPNEKPHQAKLRVRKYVREHVRRMKVTYVVTGPYFDMWVNPIAGLEAVGGYVVAEKKACVIGDGEGKIVFCTMVE
jgi:uncharacterized protein YbjT (DUF2867 family)